MIESSNYPVTMMCQALDVSRSGFYAWKTRPQSARSIENDELVKEMHAIHKQLRKSYGSPRMSSELQARGKSCSRGRAERLMRENSIAAKPKKKFVLTTQADPTKLVAENLLDRNFLPTGPNQSWASDITYIRTQSGWLYLAVTMDLFSRKVVGWATSSKIDAELAVRALQMAIAQRSPEAGLLHHSDQGSQYTSDDFQKVLSERGMTCSMSRRGNCWDNAVVESFFGSMKAEWLDDLYRNHRDARKDIFEYIEVFYNRVRMHSTLSGISPVQFESFHETA